MNLKCIFEWDIAKNSKNSNFDHTMVLGGLNYTQMSYKHCFKIWPDFKW